MKIISMKDAQSKEIESYPYRGKPLQVKKVSIKWLSQAGPDESSPEYGLRFFTVGPKGEIPIHNHFYYQTMYILNGHLRVFSYDSKSDQKVDEKTVGPHDVIFVPTMEPHSMVNPSETEEVTFLCCIANVYED